MSDMSGWGFEGGAAVRRKAAAPVRLLTRPCMRYHGRGTVKPLILLRYFIGPP